MRNWLSFLFDSCVLIVCVFNLEIRVFGARRERANSETKQDRKYDSDSKCKDEFRYKHASSVSAQVAQIQIAKMPTNIEYGDKHSVA
jgi:hypothetical protein